MRLQLITACTQGLLLFDFPTLDVCFTLFGFGIADYNIGVTHTPTGLNHCKTLTGALLTILTFEHGKTWFYLKTTKISILNCMLN